jgi:hypothetical protein
MENRDEIARAERDYNNRRLDYERDRRNESAQRQYEDSFRRWHTGYPKEGPDEKIERPYRR